jgi:hypothetical protein
MITTLSTKTLLSTVALIVWVSVSGWGAQLTAAQSSPISGCSLPSTYLYEKPTSNCTAFTNCDSDFCSCIGGSTGGSGSTGCQFSTNLTCDKASSCIGVYVKCLNAASGRNSCGPLSALHASLLSVEAGNLYNSSTAYKSCVYLSCLYLNATLANGTDCQATGSRLNNQLCVPTVSYRATLKVKGDGFTGILASPGAEDSFKNAFSTDLQNLILIDLITVWSVKATVTRRAQDYANVDFEVRGASASNNLLKTGVAAATSGSSWLRMVSAIYNQLGGVGSLTVVGLTQTNPYSTGSGSDSSSGTAAPPRTTKAPVAPTQSPIGTAPRKNSAVGHTLLTPLLAALSITAALLLGM